MATVILSNSHGSLIPVDQAGFEFIDTLSPGKQVKCVITQPRNLGFHRKFFALLDVAFDAWEAPALVHKGVIVEKNRERFRKDLTILCGHYETVVNINGELRLEAKSISFSSMDEKDFGALYSTAIDAILGKVLKDYTKDDLDRIVNQVLSFS